MYVVCKFVVKCDCYYVLSVCSWVVLSNCICSLVLYSARMVVGRCYGNVICV